ncbi:CBS domain-containing protein [Catellatospora sichuanensis]|uniref:CBS domain-containing protein n=1 Tax=Catellatospora sichuanensis TaxID=1969805 RepID=UPI0016434FE0|nr:CBS domain-containing protein [Catellatospora sichuanensis]
MGEQMIGRTIRDVMTGRPVRVDAGTTLTEAARLMRDHGIGDVLVTDGERLIGIVTSGDIVRVVAAERDPGTVVAGELTNRELVTVHADDDTGEAARIMKERSLRRLPVCESDRVIGVITWNDLTRGQRPQPPDSDEGAPGVGWSTRPDG